MKMYIIIINMISLSLLIGIIEKSIENYENPRLGMVSQRTEDVTNSVSFIEKYRVE